MKTKTPATIAVPDIVGIRKRLGLTQKELAKELRVSRRTVIRWEAGDTRPYPMAIMLIGDLLAEGLQ